MDTLLDTLINILERQGGVYGALLEIAAVKQDVIVANDAQKLNTIVAQEKELIAQLNKLEEQRVACVQSLSGKSLSGESLSGKPGVTLSDIIARAAPAKAKKLSELQESLSAMIGRVRQQNETNHKLLQTQLTYIDFMLNMMAGTTNMNNIYEQGGGREDNAATSLGIFDASV